MIYMERFYTHVNLEDPTLVEMAEIGRIDTLIVRVYGSEGPVPHFHFVSKNKEIDGCIRIDKPEYFPHGNHTSKLTGKNLKNMINFLNAPHKRLGKHGYTNWDVICMYWDDDNVDYQIPEDLKMPDYTLLK